VDDIDSSRKVLIFGAGVSASCGIAVAKDILRAAIFKVGERSHEAKEISEALKYLYPDFEPRFKTYPNIEDFLNLIEMATVFNTEEFIESSLWPRERLERVKGIVLKIVSDYIWSFSQRQRPVSESLLAYITNHVADGDIIITFNWDLTIEQAISHRRPPARVRYQYSRGTKREEITLLKPHGSVNWFDKDLAPLVHRCAGVDLDEKIRSIDQIDLLLAQDLTDATPVLVPPLTNKNFSSYAVLSQTWNSIYRAVSDASILTILGYSLPKEDQFSRFVLRRALRQNVLRSRRNEKESLAVVVVNPDEATEGAFARLMGKDHVEFNFHRAYFEDFVEGLQGQN
jgi:hypothetical protein